MMRELIKKWDIIMVIFLLLIAGVLWIAGCFRKNGAYVIINTEKECEGYPLDKNEEIVIENPDDGSKNVVRIQDGKVSMTFASCPDLICVHHKPIDKNGEMIVCVPNGVSLEIVSNIENDIDN